MKRESRGFDPPGGFIPLGKFHSLISMKCENFRRIHCPHKDTGIIYGGFARYGLGRMRLMRKENRSRGQTPFLQRLRSKQQE